MPILGPNISFLVLYVKNEVANQNCPSLYADIRGQSPQGLPYKS